MSKPILCEKPYALTKSDLKAAKNIEELIEYEKEQTGNGLIGEITAHFAHKPASYHNNYTNRIKKYNW